MKESLMDKGNDWPPKLIAIVIDVYHAGASQTVVHFGHL